MNIVDSSGWLEYFADGPNASFFSRPLAKTSDLVVPSITIYEVFKVVLRQRGESEALQAIALMQQGSVVDLTAEIAILAAKVRHRMPPADGRQHHPGDLTSAWSYHMDSGFQLRENRRGPICHKERHISEFRSLGPSKKEQSRESHFQGLRDIPWFIPSEPHDLRRHDLKS